MELFSSRLDYDDVAELTSEDGHLSMSGGPLSDIQTKPPWLGADDDRLESIVHQAACNKCHVRAQYHHSDANNISLADVVASSQGIAAGESDGTSTAAGSCRYPSKMSALHQKQISQKIEVKGNPPQLNHAGVDD